MRVGEWSNCLLITAEYNILAKAECSDCRFLMWWITLVQNFRSIIICTALDKQLIFLHSACQSFHRTFNRFLFTKSSVLFPKWFLNHPLGITYELHFELKGKLLLVITECLSLSVMDEALWIIGEQDHIETTSGGRGRLPTTYVCVNKVRGTEFFIM